MSTPEQKRYIIIGVAVGAVGLAAACIAFAKVKGKGGHGHSHSHSLGNDAAHTHSHGRAAQDQKATSKPDSGIRPVSTIPKRGYTKEELSQFDGVKNTRIFVSLKRKVYEVAPQFYGPGADYHVFAGTEASRSLAKSLLTTAEANKYWVDCSEEELEVLDDYVAKFDSKYPVVGWFIPDKSFYDI